MHDDAIRTADFKFLHPTLCTLAGRADCSRAPLFRYHFVDGCELLEARNGVNPSSHQCHCRLFSEALEFFCIPAVYLS